MLLSTSRRYAQRSLRNRLLHAAAVCLCVFAPAVVVIGELGGSASASLSAKIDTDADGIPNQVDNDIDGDGILNSVDPEVDGDGIANGPDLDVDGDTLLNGDKKELDVDSDGIADNIDPDIDGDGLMNGADADVDGDGVQNAVDPDVDGDAIKNAKDPDIDGDGLLNGVDPDIDGDGILNGVDTDTDGDGKANDAKSEKDTDSDGLKNAEDPDIDGDGMLNAVDPDVDGDGIANATDPDIDGDGRLNGASSEKDIDGDGVLDAADPDVDGDGIANATDPDIDGDGVLNATDNDQDGDGVSNKRDSDSNGDGTDDPSETTPPATTRSAGAAQTSRPQVGSPNGVKIRSARMPVALEEHHLKDSPVGGVHASPLRNTSRGLVAINSLAAPGVGPIGVTYNGSPALLEPSRDTIVQHNIRVYVIYWGPQWATNDPSSQAISSAVGTFFTGISGSRYQQILHQYYSTANGVPQAHISETVDFAGSAIDPSALPAEIGKNGTEGDVAKEIAKVFADNAWTNSDDTQVFVLTGSGPQIFLTESDGTQLSSLNNFCAYHSFNSAPPTVPPLPSQDKYVYSLIPLQTEVSPRCVTDSGLPVTDVAQATTEMVSHEYAEAATDPDTRNGWRTALFTLADGSLDTYEIGDICRLYNAIELGVRVQSEWDNAQHRCTTKGSPQAVQTLPGDACNANSLFRNDDSSTGVVSLPFSVNFFGNTYSSLYVNNNGNITFNGPLSTYTPFGLVSNTLQIPIIAPFFGDVDTRGIGSELVHYGSTPDGSAMCVNWVDVGYFSNKVDKLNSFQLILFDRSHDPGGQAGDFDIVMNYDHVQWETGDASDGVNGLGGIAARAGFSNGTGLPGTFFEFPGSGSNGAFIDSSRSADGLTGHNANAPGQPGRYIFRVRGGAAPIGASITGKIYANSVSPATTLLGAFVQVCPTVAGTCRTSSTGADGSYQVGGLPVGAYNIRAFAPGGSLLSPASRGPETITGSIDLAGVDLVLTGPAAIPTGTTITNISISSGGQPVVYWRTPLTLTTHGCVGGTASYTVALSNALLASGPMAGSGGTYSTTIPQLFPNVGVARVTITITCPDSSVQTIPFDIYIDPSGTVTDQNNNPVAGATVTLLRSDNIAGPFSPVPSGSGIMSPSNQRNPMTTIGNGLFGWDVLAGYYEVRAEKVGCVSASDPTQAFALSPVLTIPPAATDLVLSLVCVPPNIAPIAAFITTPTSGTAPLAVAFDGSTSTDTDGTITSYTWDFGDATTATGATTTHTYTTAGTYTTTLTVTDNNGATGTATQQVTANTNIAPRLSFRVTDEAGNVVWTVTAPFSKSKTIRLEYDRNGAVAKITGKATVVDSSGTRTTGAFNVSRDHFGFGYSGTVRVRRSTGAVKVVRFNIRGNVTTVASGGAAGQGFARVCVAGTCSTWTLDWTVNKRLPVPEVEQSETEGSEIHGSMSTLNTTHSSL